MNTPRSSPIRAAGGRRARSLGFAITALVASLFTTNVLAQAPAAAPAGAAPAGAATASPEQLDQLVGRIALYPDDLVSIILPASTNPLQVVQADRYLEKRKADAKLPVDDKWDDAVKSLLNYPEVVKTMSSDLDWTAALGEAVVADQGQVLQAIQAFRRKAQSAGSLKTDDKQVVVVEKEVIKIVPADPQVVYVPQYNPSTVVVAGGYSPVGYYPAPYPSYYYPYAPGAALATGLIWGAAIGAAWGGNHYSVNYNGNANINVDRNTNINSGNRASQRPAGGGSSQWKSGKQPGQVSSGVGGARQQGRVGDSGAGGGGMGGARASTQPGGGGGGGARASAQPSGGMGGGASGRGSGGGGGSALGGYGSGHQAQMDSSRGASSRSSMSSSGARSSPSASSRSAGGGSRGGGGGGGRGGGGGGRR